MKKLADYADDNGVYSIDAITVGERTEAFDLIGHDITAIQFTVSGIGTNVIIGLEISLDNVNYDNADTANAWTTKTTDGTYTLIYEGKMRYIRFYWVSSSGGSPVMSGIKIYGG